MVTNKRSSFIPLCEDSRFFFSTSSINKEGITCLNTSVKNQW